MGSEMCIRDRLWKHLKKQEKTIHILSIEPEYFRAHTKSVVSKIKDYLYELDPNSDIVFIDGDLLTLNKISAISSGYGIESFYLTKNTDIKPRFLFYVSKVYILRENDNFKIDHLENTRHLALK